MKKAITTRFMGPTNTQGSRFKATAEGGQSVIIARDYEKDHEAEHCRVAEALATSLEWFGLWIAGGMGSTGNCYVCLSLEAASQLSASYVVGKEDLIGREGVDWFYVGHARLGA